MILFRNVMTLSCCAVWVLSASPAAAFHSDTLFDDDASEGGGGGLYYSGSEKSQRYTCGVCHLDAAGKIYFQLGTEPKSLLENRTYTPGEIYDITVEIKGEEQGLTAAVNYNTFVGEFALSDGEGAGAVFGYDENLLRAALDRTVIFARGQKNLGQPKWTFKWQAPEAGSGYVDLFLAGVDGDGAQDTGEPNTDPLGDDVAAGSLRFAENSSEEQLPIHGEIVGESCAAMPLSAGWVPATILGLVLRRKRKKLRQI